MSTDSSAYDVKNTIASTYLDDMLARGRISAEVVEQYKNNYKRLHQAVLQSFNNEKMLLEKARDLASLLEAERNKIEDRITKSQGTQAEIDRLQQEADEIATVVQTFHNEVSVCKFELEEIQSSIRDNESIRSQNEAKQLNELAPIHEKLQLKLEELSQDVLKYRELTSAELEQGEAFQRKIDALMSQCNAMEKNKAELRAQLELLLEQPDKIKSIIHNTEIGTRRLKNDLTIAEKKDAKLNATISSLDEELEHHRSAVSKCLAAIDELNTSKMQIDKVVTVTQSQNQDVSHKIQDLQQRASELKMEEERLQELCRSHTTSTSNIQRQLEQERQLYSHARRKNDRLIANNQLLQREHEEFSLLHRELDQEIQQQTRLLQELKQDEELFTAQVLAQEKMESETRHVVEESIAERTLVENRIQELQVHERNLLSHISSLSGERDSLARKLGEAKDDYSKAKDALRAHNCVLEGYDKATADVQTQLRLTNVQYEKITNDRHRLQRLHRTLEQALVALHVKVRTLENEHSVAIKEYNQAENTRKTYENRLQTLVSCRDQAKLDYTRLLQVLKEAREERHRQTCELSALIGVIHHNEGKLADLHSAYVNTTDNRNIISLRLIDKNDELAVMHDQINVLRDVLTKGDEKLSTLQQKLRAVKLDIAELRRKTEMKRRLLPSLPAYTQVISTIQRLENDLHSLQQVSQVLSSKLEGRDGAGAADDKASEEGRRCRILGGEDPSAEVLTEKVRVLEGNLNIRKEQLAEREMVLGALTGLSNKLKVQAAESRGATLEIATRINEYQAKLRQLGKKMMGAISELSLYQATTMKLQASRQEVQSMIEIAQDRMKKGEAPTDDAEYEWFRQERDRAIRKEAFVARQHRAKAEAETQEKIALGIVVKTTAEPRPNHYVGEDIALPKPYGALAPFKPQVNGATMRHIRKPVPREVQL